MFDHHRAIILVKFLKGGYFLAHLGYLCQVKEANSPIHFLLITDKEPFELLRGRFAKHAVDIAIQLPVKAFAINCYLNLNEHLEAMLSSRLDLDSIATTIEHLNRHHGPLQQYTNLIYLPIH